MARWTMPLAEVVVVGAQDGPAECTLIPTEVMGRLDALVDLVFDRYKDRYFSGEKVFVDLAGDKCVLPGTLSTHQLSTNHL